MSLAAEGWQPGHTPQHVLWQWLLQQAFQLPADGIHLREEEKAGGEATEARRAMPPVREEEWGVIVFHHCASK